MPQNIQTREMFEIIGVDYDKFTKVDKNKKLSKGHKKLVAYINENYEKAAFMTASKLGEKVGVSESPAQATPFERSAATA